MVQITIGNATNRKKVVVEPTAKISDILKNNEIDYSSARVTCNGETLRADQFGLPLNAVIGDADSCYLMAVVKLDNGTSNNN